jgi:hypothetical protein
MRNGSEGRVKNTDCLILKFGTEFKESRNGVTAQYNVSNVWKPHLR